MHLIVFPIKMCQLFVLCCICSPLMWSRDLFAKLASISRLYAQDWRLRQQICCSPVLEWHNTTSVCMRLTSSCDSEGNFLPTVRKKIIIWRYSDQRSTTRGILLEKTQHAHRRKLNQLSVSQQQQVSIDLDCYSAFLTKPLFNVLYMDLLQHLSLVNTRPHKIFRPKFKIYVFELHIKSIQFNCSFKLLMWCIFGSHTYKWNGSDFSNSANKLNASHI